jgi:hypothetical protein
VLNDLATLVERIKLLQEELAAKLNEQTNRTLFTLTMVTVLALPINIVAGFFGMNVGGVPLANHRMAFGCWWCWWPALPCWPGGGPSGGRLRAEAMPPSGINPESTGELVAMLAYNTGFVPFAGGGGVDPV